MPYDNRNLYSSHITDLPNYDQQVRAYRTFLKSIHQQPHVAVVDESYREPERVKGQTQQGFYALTATIVRNENFPILRERFLDITSYWHTTEAAKTKFARRAKFNSGNWEGNILPMMKVAHAHVETNLVTVHAKIPYVPGAKALNHHVENARKECITTMTKVLTRDPRVPVSQLFLKVAVTVLKTIVTEKLSGHLKIQVSLAIILNIRSRLPQLNLSCGRRI